MAAASDTLALAAEERAKQGIHELEISFGGELDLQKHFKNCKKNPGHENFFSVSKLEKYHLPKPYSSSEIIDWIIRVSAFTVKIFVKYASPNRPPGYPLSSRAGQGVLTVGSGYVTDIIPIEENDRLQPVRGYIIVVTAGHVVFDDEEAKNTVVEFFYDDPDDKRGVMTATGLKVIASSVEGDFCELLCVTLDKHLIQRLHCLWKIPKHKVRRICDLFGYILPGLENIELMSDETLKLLVTIRVKYPYEAVEALVLLGACTEEVVDNALTHWRTGRERLKSNIFKQQNLLNMINFELHVAKLTDDNKITTSFLQLHSSLVALRETVRHTIIGSSQKIQHAFRSLISILVQYYSTAESVEKRLYLQLAYPGIDLGLQNRQKVVNIGNGSATVEVTLLRTNERFDMYRTMAPMFVSDSGRYECENKLTEMVPDNTERKLHNTERDPVDTERKPDGTERKPDDTERKPDGTERKPDDTERKPDDTERKPDDTERKPDDTERKPDGTERKPDGTERKPDDTERKRDDRECKLRVVVCKSNDLVIIHIAHPHGQSKQVTIGRQTDCFTGDGFYHQLYTAPTCPGCSGGPVWVIPASGDLSQVYGVPHSGHIGNELNTGCSLSIYPPKTLLKYPTLKSRESEKLRYRSIASQSAFHSDSYSNFSITFILLLCSLLHFVLKEFFV